MCSLHLTHPSGAVGSRLCGARGAVGVSVPCSRVSPQSWTLPAGAGIRTHNLGLPRVSSPTLYPLGHDCLDTIDWCTIDMHCLDCQTPSIIAQVCNNPYIAILWLATIKGHSKMCSFTVLGGPLGSENQSVSGVTTICLTQCNTSPSHRVD